MPLIKPSCYAISINFNLCSSCANPIELNKHAVSNAHDAEQCQGTETAFFKQSGVLFSACDRTRNRDTDVQQCGYSVPSGRVMLKHG